jgi:hypothetical protein
VSLRGNALGVLGNLPEGKKLEYGELVKVLEERFAPPSQTELYRVQMKERRQKTGETLPELGQAIRRLANLAYPTASSDIRESLSKDQFVDALVDSEMRFRITQSRPGNLNEAIKLAVELEAYNRAEHKTRHLQATLAETGEDANSLPAMLTKLTEKVDKLQKDVDEMKGPKTSSWSRDFNRDSSVRGHGKTKDKKCSYCHKPGHLRRDCLLLKKANSKRTDKPNKHQSATSTETQNVTRSSVGANSIGDLGCL